MRKTVALRKNPILAVNLPRIIIIFLSNIVLCRRIC